MSLPATTTATSSVGQSATGIYPGFATTPVPVSGQNVTRQLDRLRAPTSAMIVVQQEDVRDIAGLFIDV